MSTSCAKCGLKFSDPALAPASCPNCGEPVRTESSAQPGPFAPVKDYFANVWRILTRPSEFFRALPVTGGVAGPLAFALVTHWLGAAASYLWHLSIGGAIGGYLDRFVRMAGDVADVDNPGRHAQFAEMTEQLKLWVWGAGAVIADPFSTLLQILFVSFLVFVGARLLITPGRDGAPREITFESALRVICYGLTPSILAALPLFGGPVAYLYRIVITVIAAREVYRTDTGRATLVALFPQVLLFGTMLLVFFALAIAFIKFFAMSL